MPQKLIDKNEKVKVRMAPSPTGPLHVGTARTAIFNYIFAQKYKGKFILRIEDTDIKRSEARWEKNIIDGFKWLGITWDEKPYHQSERAEIYTKYTEKLLKDGYAFYCWHTKEELEKERAAQTAKKEAPRHTCEHRDQKDLDKEKIKRSVIRFKNDTSGKIKFFDFIRGDIEFDAQLIGDFSIAKDIKAPLYNLAVVIDDYEMKISHVIRGEDHLSNTPKQILLQHALGITTPKYIHIALTLGPDKSKLSKRHGATAISAYADTGYLPQAMFNFLALLGWRPPGEKEIMSKDEIIKIFDVADMQQAGAIFDIEKLNWMNGEYIRALSLEKLVELCEPYLKKAGFINSSTDTNWLKKVVALEQKRIKKLSEIVDATKFIFEGIKYDPELLVWKKTDRAGTKDALEKLTSLVEGANEKSWAKENLEKIIMPAAEKMGDRGVMLWALRVALSGRKASPGPFEILEVLGKQKSLARMQEAMEKIS